MSRRPDSDHTAALSTLSNKRNEYLREVSDWPINIELCDACTGVAPEFIHDGDEVRFILMHRLIRDKYRNTHPDPECLQVFHKNNSIITAPALLQTEVTLSTGTKSIET